MRSGAASITTTTTPKATTTAASTTTKPTKCTKHGEFNQHNQIETLFQHGYNEHFRFTQATCGLKQLL